MEQHKKILFITSDKNIRTVMEFCFRGWGYEVFFEEENASLDVHQITKYSPDVIVFDIQSTNKTSLEICDTLKSDFSTACIPVITLINKRQLRNQLLNLRIGVDDYLIKPPDPLDLRIRIEMAFKRSYNNLYASPLTGLPGGIIIEEILREKVASGEPFVLGHVDIDNFKAFNDSYGYMKGDRVIMQTAYMLSTAVRAWGNKADFTGHIGGDDFIFISTPDKYKELCQNFICMFDTIIPFHYPPEERKKGFITAKDRANKMRNIPIMSVTVALVLKNNRSEFNNVIEVNERITEVKKYLKGIPGSKYMADRRISKKDDTLTLEVFSNDDSVSRCYQPLGQILVEKNLITIEELDKALKVHWKRRSPLGKVLKEMGFLSENDLAKALSCQENGLKVNEPDKV